MNQSFQLMSVLHRLNLFLSFIDLFSIQKVTCDLIMI